MKKIHFCLTLLITILFFSCGSDDTVKTDSITTIKTSVTSISFDDTEIASEKKLTFDITNTGNTTIENASITNTNNVFLSSETTFSLAPNSTKTVTVTFKPTEVLEYTDVITLKLNETILATVNIKGKGINTPMETKVTYTKDIKPIMSNSCSTIGCHSGARPKANILLTTYIDVKKSFDGSQIYNSLFEIISGRMPRGKDMLPASQIELIQEWMQTNYTE